MQDSANSKASARWTAVVDDRPIPMPRRKIDLQILRDQANVGEECIIVRDHESRDDVALSESEEVDLGKGNVFRTVRKCDAPALKDKSDAPAKLAFFVDDEFKLVVKGEQTEDSLRRLFDLSPRIQLLRDLESPNDQPVGDGDVLRFTDGPVFITCTDIEKHCGCEEPPPQVQKYIIRVDDTRYVVTVPEMTGREILVLAGKDPNEWMLNQRIKKRFDPVKLDQVVDFTVCGIERFTTLPNEQSEGRPAIRQFQLPEEDAELLDSTGLQWETVRDGDNWLIVHEIPMPDAFVARKTSVAIRVPSGYPTTALDMGYFFPPIQRVDGQVIPATQARVTIQGNSWQQWSRHYTSANPWVAGKYNVFTHYQLTQAWLDREAIKGK